MDTCCKWRGCDAMILWVIGAYVLLSPVVNIWVTTQHARKQWVVAVQYLTGPGCIPWLILLAVVSTPYFFLYPENHAHRLDVVGTDEQKAELQRYREDCAKRGIIARMIENLGFRPYAGPEWPTSLDIDVESRSSGEQ